MPPVVLASLALVAGASFYSLWRGGEPERIAAKIVIVWILTDVGYHLLFGPSGFVVVDPAHLVIDGGELVAITWLALRANRIWPIWAAAAQVMTFSGHIVVLIAPGGVNRAYWAMTQIPPYVQLLAMVCGAVFHAHRYRRIGPYRSWRLS
jgi:hypothetical protein